jgi:NADH-quinone oxidoreductase subunit N
MNTLLMVFDKKDIIAIYPEVYIFIASSILLCLILYYKFSIKKKNVYIAIISLYILIYSVFLFVITMPLNSGQTYLSWDLLVISVKIVLCIVLFCLVAVSIEIFKRDPFISLEYIYFFLLLLLGFCLFVSSFDFLYLYLTLEFISLNLYLLALFTKYSNFSAESAVKYFLLSSVASSLLLFAPPSFMVS